MDINSFIFFSKPVFDRNDQTDRAVGFRILLTPSPYMGVILASFLQSGFLDDSIISRNCFAKNVSTAGEQHFSISFESPS